MIHRLDLGRLAADRRRRLRPPAADLDGPGRRPASSSSWWSCATTGILQASPTRCGLAAIVLLLLPLVPGLGADINGARIWIRRRRVLLPARRDRQDLLVIFFAGYLVSSATRWRWPAAGSSARPAPRPRPRPDPADVAGQPGRPGLPARPRLSLLFFGLFVVLLYVATERPGWLVVGGGAVPRRRLLRLPAVQPRADPRRHLARPVLDDPRSQTTRSSRRCSGLAWGGILGRGLGQGSPS